MPPVGTRPRVGLNPTTPQRADGTRREARVSVPREANPTPVATAIAEPPLEPPEIAVGSKGFRHWGVVTPRANSWVATLARISAPAARRRATATPSVGAGDSYARDPARVGIPVTWMMSFTVRGTPWRGPRSRPPAASASSRSASRRTASTSRWTTAPSSAVAPHRSMASSTS